MQWYDDPICLASIQWRQNASELLSWTERIDASSALHLHSLLISPFASFSAALCFKNPAFEKFFKQFDQKQKYCFMKQRLLCGVSQTQRTLPDFVIQKHFTIYLFDLHKLITQLIVIITTKLWLYSTFFFQKMQYNVIHGRLTS